MENSKRINIFSGTRWESTVGYSRAVRIGNIIEVAGTTAVEGDQIVGMDDVYKQTIFVLQKIESAIQQAGGSLDDVIRTRIFTTDISQWEKIGEAHGLVFKNIRPVTTMVEVHALINDFLLVEIEATAIISDK